MMGPFDLNGAVCLSNDKEGMMNKATDAFFVCLHIFTFAHFTFNKYIFPLATITQERLSSSTTIEPNGIL